MTGPGTNKPYTLYYIDSSYYSGKMQAYLRFKRIPFRQVQVTWTMMARKILPATGLMEVPVIQRPDGSWMRDSTAMIEWFEQRYPPIPDLCTRRGHHPGDPGPGRVHLSPRIGASTENLRGSAVSAW